MFDRIDPEGYVNSREPMRPRGERARYWERFRPGLVDPTRTRRAKVKATTRRLQREAIKRAREGSPDA